MTKQTLLIMLCVLLITIDSTANKQEHAVCIDDNKCEINFNEHYVSNDETYEWRYYPILTLPRINLYNLSDDYKIQINIAKQFNHYLHLFGTVSFYNHTIENSLIDQLLQSGKFFFQNNPLSIKMEYHALGFGSSGYSPLGSYAAAKRAGIADQPPDLTENFVMFNHDGAISHDDKVGFGPIKNKCPAELYNVSRIYIPKIQKVLEYINKIAAIALNLSDINYFVKYYSDYSNSDSSMYQLRWFNYPLLNLSNLLPKQMRVSQHKDSLGFTLLFNCGERGAQIKINKNLWIDYKTHDIYDMILNTGTLYERWTNDHWISNMHRVIPTNKERITISYFNGPDKQTLIEPIKECNICFDVEEEDTRKYKYEPITVQNIASKIYEASSLMETAADKQFYHSN